MRMVVFFLKMLPIIQGVVEEQYFLLLISKKTKGIVNERNV